MAMKKRPIKYKNYIYQAKKDEAEAIFPSELLDDLTLVGTKEEIKEKFNVWKNSNVTELSIGLPVDLETIKYLNTLNEMY